MDQFFRITNRWLHDFVATPPAGWTAKQLRTIGVPWPPPSGWARALDGSMITQQARLEFESHHKRVLVNMDLTLHQHLQRMHDILYPSRGYSKAVRLALAHVEAALELMNYQPREQESINDAPQRF